MFTTTRKKQLANRIRARREELGLRQDTVQDSGGPSPETVNQYEQGNIPDQPQNRTLHGYDRALRWQTGSIRRFLETGEEPTPIDTPREHVLAVVPENGAAPGLVPLPKKTIEAIVRSASKLALLARVSDCRDEALLNSIAEVQQAANDLHTTLLGMESRDPEILSVIARIAGS